MCSSKVLRLVLTIASLSSVVLSALAASVPSSTISADQPYGYSFDPATPEDFKPSNDFLYQESLSEVPDSFKNIQAFPYQGIGYPNYGQRNHLHSPSPYFTEMPLRDSELSRFLPEFIRFMETMMIIMAKTPKSSSSGPNFHQPGKTGETIHPNPSYDFLFGGDLGAPGLNDIGESGFTEGRHQYFPVYPGFGENHRENPEETDVPLKSLTHAKNLTRYCVFQGISPLNPGECDKYLVCLPARFNRFNAYIAQCPDDKKFSTIYRRCVQPYLVPECSKIAVGRSGDEDIANPDSQVEVFAPEQFQKKKHEMPLYRPIKAVSTSINLNEIPVAVKEPLFTYTSAYKLGQNLSEFEDSSLAAHHEIDIVTPAPNQQSRSTFLEDSESLNATTSRPDNTSSQIGNASYLPTEDNNDVTTVIPIFDSDPSSNHSTNSSNINDSLDSYFDKDDLIATNYLNGSVSNSSNYQDILELYTDDEESYSQNENNTDDYTVGPLWDDDSTTEHAHQPPDGNTTVTSSSHFETDMHLLDTISQHPNISNSSHVTDSEYQDPYNEEQTEEILSQFETLHPSHINVSTENSTDTDTDLYLRSNLDLDSTLDQNSTIAPETPDMTSTTFHEDDQLELNNTTSTASYSASGNESSHQSESIVFQEYYTTPTPAEVTTEANGTNSSSLEPMPSDQAQNYTQSRAHHPHTTNVDNPVDPVPQEESYEFATYDVGDDRDHSFDTVGDIIMETPYVFPPNPPTPNSNPVRRSVRDTDSHTWRKQ